MILLKEIDLALANLRQIKPLILCITNFVTMDLMANSLLALGAAPLMTQAFEEVEELVTISQAVYINIGTLDGEFFKRALRAAELAVQQKKPVILDPVGAGASQLRTEAAKLLLPYATIIRGNASEILALVENDVKTKGVESLHNVNQACAVAQMLANSFAKIVVISGPDDFVTDGSQHIKLPFGSELMSVVTGMGCTMTAVIAAFAATSLNHYQASLFASTFFGLCGQVAAGIVDTPGSFRQVFIDTLYKPDWNLFEKLIAAAKSNEAFENDYAI